MSFAFCFVFFLSGPYRVVLMWRGVEVKEEQGAAAGRGGLVLSLG